MQSVPAPHRLPVSFFMLETNAPHTWYPASHPHGAEGIRLSTSLTEEQHVGKGGSAVPKLEM